MAASGRSCYLAIDEILYYQFASIFFESKGRKLAKEVFQWVYTRFEGHTWYMQAMLNRLFEKEEPVAEIRQAIAKEKNVLSPNSGEFIKRYGLKTPSSVSTALKSLLEKN